MGPYGALGPLVWIMCTARSAVVALKPHAAMPRCPGPVLYGCIPTSALHTHTHLEPPPPAHPMHISDTPLAPLYCSL